MFSFQSSFRNLAAAVGLLTVAALPTSAATLNFEFTGPELTGTGTAVFDTTGAPSVDPYLYRAGDTFLASITFDFPAFDPFTIHFTEADITNPISISFLSGNPVDLFYAGNIIEAPGRDLGPLDQAGLLMGQGAFVLQVHFDTGEEANFQGTYVFVNDEPPPNDVPEPASAALLGAGLAAIALRRRRRA